MERLLGFVGRMIDRVLAHVVCAVITCDPDNSYTYCLRCGLNLW